jgi:hypothetical protein
MMAGATDGEQDHWLDVLPNRDGVARRMAERPGSWMDFGMGRRLRQ